MNKKTTLPAIAMIVTDAICHGSERLERKQQAGEVYYAQIKQKDSGGKQLWKRKAKNSEEFERDEVYIKQIPSM